MFKINIFRSRIVGAINYPYNELHVIKVSSEKPKLYTFSSTIFAKK